MARPFVEGGPFTSQEIHSETEASVARQRNGRFRPWFETAECSSPRGRLLLISYHFPPSTRIGALRWQEFTTLFAQQGWSVDVISCPPSRSDTHRDQRTLEVLSPGLRLFAAPHEEHPLFRLENSLLDRVRDLQARLRSRATGEGGVRTAPSAGEAAPANLGDGAGSDDADVATGGGETRSPVLTVDVAWNLTSPRSWLRIYWSWLTRARAMRWARAAEALGRELAAPNEYAAVICSGPPHTSHLAAAAVARAAGVPFVMDLRDPWSHVPVLNDWIASPLTTRMAARDERAAFEGASLVIANTKALERELRRSHPDTTARIITVRNGVDRLDGDLPAPARGERFSIRYAGTIYQRRDPRPLLAAVKRVVTDLDLIPEQIGLDMIGRVEHVGNTTLRELARAEGVGQYVTIGSWLPRDEARCFMEGAHVLVSFCGDNSLAIPAKIFEYMRYSAWLLVLAERDSAVARLLAETEADVVAPAEVDRVAAVLRQRYESFLRGETPMALARLRRFSRAAQWEKLRTAMEYLVGDEQREAVG